MGSLLAAALALGVAGIDPAGALIAIAALAAGARDRAVLLYGAVVLLGTALLGVVLSLTVGTALAQVDWLKFAPTGLGGAVLEVAVGAVVLAWGIIRLVRRGDTRAPRPSRWAGTSPTALAGVGAVFALSAALDPTFVALTVLAGRGHELVVVALAHLLWAMVSQAPLALLLVAVARGGHEPAVERFNTAWRRIKPCLGRVVTAVLLIVGTVLIVDAGWWFATGDFLLPDP